MSSVKPGSSKAFSMLDSKSFFLMYLTPGQPTTPDVKRFSLNDCWGYWMPVSFHQYTAWKVCEFSSLLMPCFAEVIVEVTVGFQFWVSARALVTSGLFSFTLQEIGTQYCCLFLRNRWGGYAVALGTPTGDWFPASSADHVPQVDLDYINLASVRFPIIIQGMPFTIHIHPLNLFGTKFAFGHPRHLWSCFWITFVYK